MCVCVCVCARVCARVAVWVEGRGPFSHSYVHVLYHQNSSVPLVSGANGNHGVLALQ